MRVRALKHDFSSACVAGGRKAQALSVSVGEERSPPVIAIVPALCTVLSCFITLADAAALGPACILRAGRHQTSAPYRILGIATPMYKRRAYLGVIPQEGLAALWIWAAQV